MDLNNLIIFFILIGFGLFFYKYFSSFLKKYNSKILVDDQFKKPQSFHKLPISTSGGKTNGLDVREWGAIGVTTIEKTSGCTIGPPDDKE